MHYVCVGVHNHTGGRVLLQHPLMHFRKCLFAWLHHRRRNVQPATAVRAWHDRNMARRGWGVLGPVNPVLLVHRGKKIGTDVGRFRASEKQIAARTQGEVEHLENLALGFSIQIDKQVTAADQMHMGERRIAQQAVLGKKDFLADLFFDFVVGLVLDEVLAQARRSNVGNDRRRINPCATNTNGTFVDISTEHLHLDLRRFQLNLIRQQHGQRKSFFPSRGAR